MNDRLGRWQRLFMDDLASQGVWKENREVAGRRIARCRDGAQGLAARGLVACDGRRWFLTPAGYAWLIRREADSLAVANFGSQACTLACNRISALAAQAHLTEVWGRPVNWKGDQA